MCAVGLEAVLGDETCSPLHGVDSAISSFLAIPSEESSSSSPLLSESESDQASVSLPFFVKLILFF
jgi:hypothetical protein